MTGEVSPGDADVVVYIDHSEIDMSRLGELKAAIVRLVDFIEEREPQLLAYGFHLDEDRGRMTVTVVHPDSASLERHMNVGREEFRKFGDLITLTGIEVYGSISAKVRRLLEQKVESLGAGDVIVTERFAGFARGVS